MAGFQAEHRPFKLCRREADWPQSTKALKYICSFKHPAVPSSHVLGSKSLASGALLGYLSLLTCLSCLLNWDRFKELSPEKCFLGRDFCTVRETCPCLGSLCLQNGVETFCGCYSKEFCRKNRSKIDLLGCTCCSYFSLIIV